MCEFERNWVRPHLRLCLKIQGKSLKAIDSVIYLEKSPSLNLPVLVTSHELTRLESSDIKCVTQKMSHLEDHSTNRHNAG